MGVAALLPVEILLLTLSFEPSRFGSSTHWTLSLLQQSSVVPRIAIAVAATLALILSPRATELWGRFGADSRPYPWEWVVLHLALFLGFYQQTAWLFAGSAVDPGDWQVALWVALCLAVAASWCIALAPASNWRKFLHAERRAVLVSLLAGVVVWGFGLVTRLFWRPLAEWTLFFAQGVLRLIYTNVEYDVAAGTVGTNRILIEIAPQCSGYEGLALVTVFVAIYLWIFRQRISFPRAFWLLPAGLFAIWVGNVLRIAALVAVGTSISPQIAVQGFHSQAGWISFTAIGLGLIWLSHQLGLVTKPAPRPAGEPPMLAGALIAPLVALLAMSMVAAAFSEGFDALYPAGVVVTAAVLYRYRKVYSELPFSVSARSVVIGLAVFAIWIIMEPSIPGTTGRARALMLDLPPFQMALWTVFRTIGAVLIVPIAEELAFRGYLLRKLVASDFEKVPATRFTWFSFVGSSVLFGLLHQSWFAGTVAGAAFAVAVYHRGRVTDAMVAHMTANALIAATVIGFGWWDLWL